MKCNPIGVLFKAWFKVKVTFCVFGFTFLKNQS